MKGLNTYILPIIVVILLVGFIIYASITSEGFANNCKCPDGAELRNGGCYGCEPGYKLSSDYYNAYCVSEDGKYKGANYKSVIC